MEKQKRLFGFMSILLSAGLLFGCGGNNGVDEDEPDPTEEPSEQQEQNNDNE